MGIRYLTSFIEDSFDGKWIKCEPKGYLAIDGYSLCYSLHIGNRIDWIHGGQYRTFRSLLLKFFSVLRSSGILPVVMFDGIDYKLEKEPVIWKRRRDNVKVVKSQLSGDGGARHGSAVLPLLAVEVFREVLEEMGIPLYYADGEADPDTVALARHYKCPIVANDSDYYIFNATNGYIPFSHLYWQNEPGPVTADMYTLSRFERIFEFKDSRLSRLIPAILGNDFIEGVYESHLREHIVTTAKHMIVDHSKKSSSVESLVCYISKFKDVPELLENISKNAKNGPELAKLVFDNLKQAESIYNVSYTLSEEDLMNKTALLTSSGSKLPEWVLRQYRHGYFVSSLMETLVVGKAFLRIATDDPGKPSTQLVSRHIRQSIYGILLPLMKEDTISEVVRFEADLRKEEVSCVPSAGFPCFPAVQQLSLEERIKVFCDVICIDPAHLDSYDRKWKLVVGAGCYWVKECRPNNHLIKSLVMCLLFCSVQDKDPSTLLPRYIREDRNGKWLNALHKFSSFQCIYLDLSKLNNILMNPLLFVSPAFLFDGRLLQFYACKKDIDKIIEREFKASSLFSKLLQTFMMFTASTHPEKKKATLSGPATTISSKSRSRGASSGGGSVAVSNNPFAMLTLDTSSSENEED